MGAKTIYCPNCGKEVLHTDDRFVIELNARCDKCNKLVVYTPSSNSIRIKDVPKRTTSSGKRFY